MVRRHRKRRGTEDGPHQPQGHACQRKRTPCPRPRPRPRPFCRLLRLLRLMLLLLLPLLGRRLPLVRDEVLGVPIMKLTIVCASPLGHTAEE